MIPIDLLRRPAPPRPYRPSARRLHACTNALTTTLQALRSVGEREGCCFWYGERGADGTDQLKVVVMPRQLNRLLNYYVPADAIQAAHSVARSLGCTFLANVHSHPGFDVEHSRYDDEMMPSRSALSLVFPHYGGWQPDAWPSGVGVHEFQDEYWHLLGPDHAATRILWDSPGDTSFVDMR